MKHYRAVLGVDDLIDVITCGEDVKEGKPSSGLVRLAAERLGARRAVMTGDTPYDAEAARAAGVSGLGVLTGGFREEALTDAGCFAVVRDVGEMREVLASPEAASQVAISPAPTSGPL